MATVRGKPTTWTRGMFARHPAQCTEEPTSLTLSSSRLQDGTCALSESKKKQHINDNHKTKDDNDSRNILYMNIIYIILIKKTRIQYIVILIYLF